MIKREIYMNRIRPFMGKDVIKVMTGIRRAGKSVMLALIQQELSESGIKSDNLITFNFEDLRNVRLLEGAVLHEEILERTRSLQGKVYLFFDEIQEVPSGLLWTVISILPVPMQSCYRENWLHILEDGMWNLLYILFPLRNSLNCIVQLTKILPRNSVSKSTFWQAECPI